MLAILTGKKMPPFELCLPIICLILMMFDRNTTEKTIATWQLSTASGKKSTRRSGSGGVMRAFSRYLAMCFSSYVNLSVFCWCLLLDFLCRWRGFGEWRSGDEFIGTSGRLKLALCSFPRSLAFSSRISILS